MISPKKLLKLAKKWQKNDSVKRKTIPFPSDRIRSYSSSLFSSKGHFVIYTIDQKRFVIPMPCLSNSKFRDLFKMSEEMFGLPSSGPIILPCDAVFMEYVLLQVKNGVAKDVEKTWLTVVANSCCSCSAAFHQENASQQLVCAF